MKLAEALIQRTKIQRRIEQPKSHIAQNAKAEEGDQRSLTLPVRQSGTLMT